MVAVILHEACLLFFVKKQTKQKLFFCLIYVFFLLFFAFIFFYLQCLFQKKQKNKTKLKIKQQRLNGPKGFVGKFFSFFCVCVCVRNATKHNTTIWYDITVVQELRLMRQ